MGGVPITALSILAYPVKGDLDDLAAILAGGADKIHEAGCVVVGGHSVNDDEIKFGYSITGTVHPDRVLTNAGARPGDVLLFTKRIGTGVIATALKHGLASDAHVQQSIASMLTLNRSACQAMLTVTVHSCTDVSGFGLLGHAREMAAASNVTLEIDPDRIKFLPGALEYAAKGAIPGGLRNNKAFVESNVKFERAIPADMESLLYDPQTSGGLLIALPEKDAAQLESAGIYRIGRVLEKQEKLLVVL
jgi:selenide,water dikinase